MKRATTRLTTVHYPEKKGKDGKPVRSCSHHTPECSESHYYQVPAIETRGSFPLAHMLSNSSARALLTVYVAVGGSN